MGRTLADVVASVVLDLSREQGQEAILETLLEGACEALGADARAWWSLQLAEGRVVGTLARGLPESCVRAVASHYEELSDPRSTIVGELLRGSPALVEQTSGDPRIHPAVARAGFHAALFVPVRVAEVPQGALAFYYRESRRFPPEVVGQAQGLADLAALVVHHCSTVQLQGRALTEARLLLQSSEAISSSRSLDEILDELLKLLPRSLGYVGCRIYLLEEGEGLRVRPPFEDGPAASLAGLPSCVRAALGTGEPQTVGDEAFLERLGSAAGAVVDHALAVPLLVRGESIGVIVVGRRPDGEGFGRSDLRLLKGLARHASMALEQARLVAGLESSRSELQALASTLEDRVRERTRALEEAHHELLRSERMATLGRLAATVAHELRNPLAVVRTSACYLRQRCRGQDERVDRHLQLIDHQVQAAGRIITELLDFSREVVPNRAPLDVNRVAREVLAQLSVPDRVQAHLELSEDLPPIRVDPIHLEQCLRNLVHNALQAMPEGGTLTLRTGLQERGAVLEVQDTGLGIPPEDLERIFEPLFTTRAQGCGLGLSLTRKLVLANRGHLELDSEVGRGTSFRIVLPLEP